MSKAVEYDDSNLKMLFKELSHKERVKALRGAFRKEGNSFKRAAVNHLRSSIRSSKDLEKGIRVIVFKKKAGFRVTVGTKKGKDGKTSKGYHTNRYGKDMPILIWAEEGTKSRYRRSRRRRSLFGKKTGNRFYTGKLKAYKFMGKARDEKSGQITENIHRNFREYVLKAAKKHGCK